MAVLRVRAFGPRDAPPVLIVHGVRNIGARYRRLAEEALPGWRVLAVDLRGHGDSTWLPPWDVGQHLDDLLETLDAFAVGRCPVVGHSFGGLLAIGLAARAPARVSRLVLLDPAVALDRARCGAEAEATARDDGWASPEEALEARRALRPPHARDTADEDLETFLAESADGRFRLRYFRPAVTVAWSEMARPPASLAGWPGEALLLQGLLDDWVSPALLGSLRADLGDRLAVRGLECGHMIVWDAFEETAALVAPFLAGA